MARARLGAAVVAGGLLIFAPAAAFAQLSRAETLFPKALAAYQAGHYQVAFDGFMDVVLADPNYPDAHKYLDLASKALIKQQNVKAVDEREQLLAEIEELHEWEKRPQKARWQKLFDSAVKLAEDESGGRFALEVYRQSLQAFPVEPGGLTPFHLAHERFFRAYWGARWGADSMTEHIKNHFELREKREGELLRQINALEDAIEKKLEARSRKASP